MPSKYETLCDNESSLLSGRQSTCCKDIGVGAYNNILDFDLIFYFDGGQADERLYVQLRNLELHT